MRLNMYCRNCGKEVNDTADFCPHCGTAISEEGIGQKKIEFSDVAKYAEQQAKKVTDNVQAKTQNFKEEYHQEQESRRIHNIKDLFVNPDEEQKAIIGSGYLGNLLRTGSMSKGFGILTDRRFYFRGTCYVKTGKLFVKTDEEWTVDLQDITSSGFIYTRNILLGLITIIFTVFNIFMYSIDGDALCKDLAFWLIVFVLPNVLICVAYILFKRAIYEVRFSGGSISIKASSYGINKIKAFDKQLRLAKDEYLEKIRQHSK